MQKMYLQRVYNNPLQIVIKIIINNNKMKVLVVGHFWPVARCKMLTQIVTSRLNFKFINLKKNINIG